MSDVTSEFFTSNSELELTLKKHLENWDVVSARRELDLDIHREWIARNSWELVPMVCSFLTNDIQEKCPTLIQACHDILIVLAERGVAKELLMSLLEHIEAFTENIKFRKVLPCLSLVLQKLSQKTKKLSWAWTFDTMYSHICGTYTMPKSSSLQNKKERILFENDPDVLILIDTMEEIVLFLDPLVGELSIIDSQDRSSDVIAFILHLFHKPLAYLNVRREGEESKSRMRIIVEKLINYLYLLENNLFSLINLEDKRTAKRIRNEKNKTTSELSDELRISDHSIGSLYSCIFGENILMETLPQMYNWTWIFDRVLRYIINLQSEKHDMCVLKGLSLCSKLLERIPIRSFDASVLESPDHHNFLTSITNVIIYHDYREYRSLAYENFTSYFNRFEIPARYKFFNYVVEISNHSGLIGIMITKLKDTILLNLNENTTIIPQFTGNSLKMLLRNICKLSHGAETDLLEVSDEVSSALNSLYVLFKRDEKNITGIWDLRKEILDVYVKQIETGISLSKAHYHLKLKEDTKNEKSSSAEVSLMVGGQALPNMSNEEMKRVLNSAVFTLEVMEVALIRLKECLEK